MPEGYKKIRSVPGRILFLVFVLNQGLLNIQCRQMKRAQAPFSDFSSCITIDVPPITLTPSRTAAERQLIGEDQELEENGWMIASTTASPVIQDEQISSGKTPSTSRAELTREYYREVSVLEFYNDQVATYRRDGILGEGSDGRLHMVPPSVSGDKNRNPDTILDARRIAQQVNRSRTRIIELLKKNALETEEENTTELLEDYRLHFFRSSQRGEWIFNQGHWERVR